MARLALAALALAGLAAASDVCTVPHYARGGRLEQIVCGGSVSESVDAVAPQTKQTPLDHDGSTTETFSQRYWVVKDYWNSTKAPIFLSVGGEGPARAPGGWTVDLARTYGALVASLEHRFYGESMPTGDPATGLAAGKLQFLTVDQALRDINVFLSELRAEVGADASAPVILVGGSYPGALVGWHRMAFPKQSVAGLASSGVVNAILDYTAFDEAVAAALPASCADVVRATTAAFDAAEQDPTTAKAARALFGSPEAMSVPDFAYMLADSAAMAVQYGTKKELCSALKPSADQETLRKQFADFTNAHYNTAFGSNCFYDTECLKTDTARWTPTSRAWRWQKCSEVAYLQSAPSAGSLRSASLTLEALKQQCMDVFGSDTPNVNGINNAYGGDTPTGSWVFYSQGSDDPWRPAGVTHTLSNTLREFTAKCDGCGHCGDLRSPSSRDPEVISHQRQLEAVFISDALKAARA